MVSRVAKNAIYLYLRTIITTIVGIFTSRIILQTLGIEDYGLYSVVGGVVGLFGFINGSMSGATSRFIIYELGKGNQIQLQKTFSSAFIVHLIIASIVLILAETVGLWFLYNKVVIPIDRFQISLWIYQLSILSALLSITQVPYDACLVAHERFDISAYISMFSVFAKLGILYLIALFPFDSLLVYAFLLLLVSFFSCIYARIFCRCNYNETQVLWSIDKKTIMPMLSFSGWQMFGNIGTVLTQQGQIFLVNNFLGVAFNAAMGIGNTLVGAINALSYNVVEAFRPSTTKSFAAGDIELFEKSVIKAAYMSFMLYGTFALPIIIERHYLLELWLKNVPPYTPCICAVHLFFSSFMTLTLTLNMAIHALGKNRKQNEFSCIIRFVAILVMYILLVWSFPFYYVLIAFDSTSAIMVIYTSYLYAKYTNLSSAKKFFLKAIMQPYFLFSLEAIFLYMVSLYLPENIIRLIFICFLSVVFSFIYIYYSSYRPILIQFLTEAKKKLAFK